MLANLSKKSLLSHHKRESRLCVLRLAHLLIALFNSVTSILVSCLHFGQLNTIVSGSIFARVFCRRMASESTCSLQKGNVKVTSRSFGIPAATAIPAALSVAGAAAGAADTAGTAFLRLVQIPAGQCENDRNHRENNEIFHTLTSFRSAHIQQPDACWYSVPKKSRWQPE